MANLALPTVGRSMRRLPKRILLTSTLFVVLALMALSFVVGRATIGGHGAAKPSAPQVTVQPVQPAQPADRGGVNCHQHEQC